MGSELQILELKYVEIVRKTLWAVVVVFVIQRLWNVRPFKGLAVCFLRNWNGTNRIEKKKKKLARDS